MSTETTPRFRVDRTKKKRPKVYLQCSNCEVDIRQIGMSESVSVLRAHYCPDCDDGAIHLNLGKSDE